MFKTPQAGIGEKPGVAAEKPFLGNQPQSNQDLAEVSHLYLVGVLRE